jgi:hypothetical protein
MLKTMTQCVATDSEGNLTPMDEDQTLTPCAVCSKPFKKKRAWQENCSDKCRLKAYWIRQIDKIIAILREEMHKAIDEFFEKMRMILVERLVK